ncbi:MAG TPA: efflux RND transporter periplasmic adaptor subunit [Gemmata sp.]|nr:efflux RND transporter periplasmic adaptor subunit [Gemmata sp.]
MPAQSSVLAGESRFRRVLRLAILVPLARLRFLFILGAIGLVLLKWDYLVAEYEKHFRPAESADAGDPDHEYFCPMHPTVVRENNKEKCPICFMPLSKRKKGAPPEPLPAGIVARQQLTPYQVVIAGVNTVPVSYVELERDITTVGTIEFNERQLKTVAARVKGRIDRLIVNETGQMVHAGDPLAELYSPDLVITVQNLLDARQSGQGGLEGNARERLKLWGIDEKQIEEILKAGKPITHLTIRSPINGHVLKRAVREGQYVEEGSALFDVADLSTVWVQAQLYEDDLAFLPASGHDPRTGKPDFDLKAIATTRAFPGRAFEGTLSFLFPHVDAETRTLTVRFELPNKDHELRPGMTATVTLKLPPELLARTPAGSNLLTHDGKVLAVPEMSVIDSGIQKVVYRESMPNSFEGIAVHLGPRMNRRDGAVYYPVHSGLAEGDRVVTTGSFLLDAETRLSPEMGSTYIGGSERHAHGVVAVRPSTPEDADAKVIAGLAQLSADDRKLAEAQVWCPIQHDRLGIMGKPLKLTLNGKKVFVCCSSCVEDATAAPDRMLQTIEELKHNHPGTAPPNAGLTPDRLAKIRAGLDQLSPDERNRAEAQRLCPVQEKPLGLMGKPISMVLDGARVFLCCPSCENEARGAARAMRKKAEDFHKLPPILPEGKR